MAIIRILLLVFLALFSLGAVAMLIPALTSGFTPTQTPFLLTVFIVLIGYSFSFHGVLKNRPATILIGGAILALTMAAQYKLISPIAFIVPISILNYGMVLRRKHVSVRYPPPFLPFLDMAHPKKEADTNRECADADRTPSLLN